MSKAEMLNTWSINIASMANNFTRIMKLKILYYWPRLALPNKKNNKAKIANLKQAKELGVIFEEDFKLEVKFILGF
jgi:hypothetical protein